MWWERALATRPEQDVAPVEKLKQTEAKPVEPVIEESFETVVEGDTEEDDISARLPLMLSNSLRCRDALSGSANLCGVEEGVGQYSTTSGAD